MKAVELYEHLENDFILHKLFDEWSKYMVNTKDYICMNFLKRSMGLVYDFADEINKVYTAVFPEKLVTDKILNDGTENAMLFVHHPSIWDIRMSPNVFSEIDVEILEEFKRRKISVYNLHVPLDNFSKYSTAYTLAEALNIEIIKPFAAYRGSLSGVIGKTDFKDLTSLNEKFSEVLGHKTMLYLYGEDNIRNGIVALIGGGGNDINFLNEMVENDAHVLITGITYKNDRSRETHGFAEENKISLLGGTHYSTEKFACIKMCEYFNKFGLSAEFTDGEPILGDM